MVQIETDDPLLKKVSVADASKKLPISLKPKVARSNEQRKSLISIQE